MKKAVKRFFIIYLVLYFIGCIGFFSMGNFIFSVILLRESLFSSSSADTAVYSGGMTENKTWLELNSAQKNIVSYDEITLNGYYAQNNLLNHKYVIICHGYSSKATDMSYFAEKFYSLGFSVLAADARAHGLSGGNVRGMGYLEKRDIIAWVNEILKTDPLAEIALFGVSMGGATVLFTSGEGDLPSCVKAVVSDCAYTDVYREVGNAIRCYVPFLPDFPVVDSASVVSEIRGAYSFRDASCIEAVKRSVTPTLFIHGSADTFVPFYMLDELYNSANCVKEKLVIEGAGHAGSASTNPELYWNGITAFISRFM